jgi:predicted transglutaminase-like cysteine proteinase
MNAATGNCAEFPRLAATRSGHRLSHRLEFTMFRTTAAAAALILGLLGPAVGQDARDMAFAQTMGDTTPPIGWVQFCSEERHARDCAVPLLRPAAVDLDERRWRYLLEVNARVNRDVEAVTDMDHWGVAEKWSYPTDGKGDCEDYALEKRRRLMEAGWPRQALLITVVRDRKGDGHAVLMVRTDRGDFILDNQEAKVKLWTETGYKFVKRQAEQSPNRWVSLGNVDTGMMLAQRN